MSVCVDTIHLMKLEPTLENREVCAVTAEKGVSSGSAASMVSKVQARKAEQDNKDRSDVGYRRCTCGN